jgi:hypothetical protein
MSLERYLQGRKLERDFPVRWARNRVLGLASEIFSVGEISRDFLSLIGEIKKCKGLRHSLRQLKFLQEFLDLGNHADTKRTTVGDRRVLNSKCPKRVGSASDHLLTFW